MGKREEKRSLGTRDPDEATRRHAQALAEVEARWENLRLGPRTLTQKDAYGIAGQFYQRWLRFLRQFGGLDKVDCNLRYAANLASLTGTGPEGLTWRA